MAIEEQAKLASELRGWLVSKYDTGADGADLLGAVALVLGDMLGQQAQQSDSLDAEALLIVLEQRFATMEAAEAMPEEEEEGFEVDEEAEEEEGDRIEGEEEEGGEEGFGV